jgi:SMI1/KNR4 family protein SUKH-1
MTEPNLSALLERLSAVVQVRPPATDKAIEAAERRLGIRVSSDFRAVYERLDGTADSTPYENGWFELWSLSKWYTVAEYVKDWSEGRKEFEPLEGAVLFADYSIESWHYAAHFSRDSVMHGVRLSASPAAVPCRNLAGWSLTDRPRMAQLKRGSTKLSDDLIALNLRRDRHSVLAEAVGSAIDEADPIGLLAMGCPGDEYSQEMGAIVPRVSKASDSSEVRER